MHLMLFAKDTLDHLYSPLFRGIQIYYIYMLQLSYISSPETEQKKFSKKGKQRIRLDQTKTYRFYKSVGKPRGKSLTKPSKNNSTKPSHRKSSKSVKVVGGTKCGIN